MAAPGLELMFNSVKSQIQNPHDSIICVLHWQLVSSGYTCIGAGENETANVDGGEGSEMLPEGWNSTPDLYILRYKHTQTGAVYIMKIINVDDVLLVHLWKDSDEKVLNMNIKSSDYASVDFSSFKKALKDVNRLASMFTREIVSKLTSSGTQCQAGPSRRGDNSRSVEDDPLRVPARPVPQPMPPSWVDPDDPFSVGRGDLDPLGPGAGRGGMYFDPMRGGRGPGMGPDPNAGLPGRLPFGAVPPGARFDPFGPPGTRPGPNPDHMRPPDYDDMFM